MKEIISYAYKENYGFKTRAPKVTTAGEGKTTYKVKSKRKPLTNEQIAAKRIVRSHPKENKALAKKALKYFLELKEKTSAQ